MATQLRRRPMWEPSLWSEFRDFERAMNRIFGDVYTPRSEYPPINVWTGKDDIVLTAELPGVETDDLDISIHENTLTIRCVQKEEKEAAERYHRRECRHGGFARSWRLPFEVERDKVEARMENGVLMLTLPRSPASKPRKVQVKATDGGARK